jgi:hypothetical protein
MAKSATVLVRTVQTEWAGSWGGAFAEGLMRHGWGAELRTDYARNDLVVFWGVSQRETIERARRDGCEVCILERSYLPDRFKYASVSFGGGLNGRGIFRGPFHDGTRFERHFAHLLQPWNPKPDGYALIMEQVPGDNSVRGVDLPGFYAKAHRAFAAQGIAAMVRAHPRSSPKSGERAIAAAYRSLADDLSGARCVVTWNSNAGVDAVLAGIPAIAMDQGSMAWDVTGHELNMPPMPDRTAWAHALAWKQWTKDEIASGACWENVRGDL